MPRRVSSRSTRAAKLHVYRCHLSLRRYEGVLYFLHAICWGDEADLRPPAHHEPQLSRFLRQLVRVGGI